MKKEAGFTTIEMIVVIGIMATLSVVVIADFPQIRLQFALARATYAFAQDIRRAQDMTLSAAQYKDASGNIKSVSGYGVNVDTDYLGNKKYIIYADAAPGNQQYENTDYIVATIDISKDNPGIIIKEIDNVVGSKVSINFSPPNPITTITQLISGQQQVDVVFAFERDTSITRTVSINTSGLVEVK